MNETFIHLRQTMHDPLYQWIEEGRIGPRWMGRARYDFSLNRILYVVVPFNWIIGYWDRFWLHLRRGKPSMCPNCRAMREMWHEAREEINRKSERLSDLISAADNKPQ